MTPDGGNDAALPPPRRWRRWAALGVLLVGATGIAATFSRERREHVEIHVGLPGSIRALRLDVRQEQRLVEHFEWVYSAKAPLSQQAELELSPGEHTVATTAVGVRATPEPLELHVSSGEAAKLAFDLR